MRRMFSPPWQHGVVFEPWISSGHTRALHRGHTIRGFSVRRVFMRSVIKRCFSAARSAWAASFFCVHTRTRTPRRREQTAV